MDGTPGVEGDGMMGGHIQVGQLIVMCNVCGSTFKNLIFERCDRD